MRFSSNKKNKHHHKNIQVGEITKSGARAVLWHDMIVFLLISCQNLSFARGAVGATGLVFLAETASGDETAYFFVPLSEQRLIKSGLLKIVFISIYSFYLGVT